MYNYIIHNGTFYEQGSDELTHYGVKGMKWGVRRAMKELHESNQTGRKGGHNHAVASLSTHRDKINKKLTALDKKSVHLESKRYKQATKNAKKIAKFEKKSAKLKLKAGKAFYTSTASKRLHKSAKLDLKVAKLKQSAAKTQAKIEKNERLKEIYKTSLKDINNELVTKGQDFLYMKSNGMPYTNADIE